MFSFSAFLLLTLTQPLFYSFSAFLLLLYFFSYFSFSPFLPLCTLYTPSPIISHQSSQNPPSIHYTYSLHPLRISPTFHEQAHHIYYSTLHSTLSPLHPYTHYNLLHHTTRKNLSTLPQTFHSILLRKYFLTYLTQFTQISLKFNFLCITYIQNYKTLNTWSLAPIYIIFIIIYYHYFYHYLLSLFKYMLHSLLSLFIITLFLMH